MSSQLNDRIETIGERVNEQSASVSQALGTGAAFQRTRIEAMSGRVDALGGRVRRQGEDVR